MNVCMYRGRVVTYIHTFTGVVEFSTDDLCLKWSPAVVADGPPVVVVAHLDATLARNPPVDQANVTIRTCKIRSCGRKHLSKLMFAPIIMCSLNLLTFKARVYTRNLARVLFSDMPDCGCIHPRKLWPVKKNVQAQHSGCVVYGLSAMAAV